MATLGREPPEENHTTHPNSQTMTGRLKHFAEVVYMGDVYYFALGSATPQSSKRPIVVSRFDDWGFELILPVRAESVGEIECHSICYL